MGLQSNNTPQRSTRPSSSHEEGSKSKKKWVNLMPFAVALVVIAEIAFLGRLDMAENFIRFNSWTENFYQFTSLTSSVTVGLDLDLEQDPCEEWLEKRDSVLYSRDFQNESILINGGRDQEWEKCAVGCKFVGSSDRIKLDAGFGQQSGAMRVHRSMESAQYYAENRIENARRKGFDVIMTTSLSSDVPVGYFSWAEYDIMAPVQPKTEAALAAAFISNCGAKNFRLLALEGLEKSGMKIDSYGACHRNRNGKVNKVETLKRYKFSFSFENSNEEDYVTEKFFQSLVAGSIPVVVGAPNIEEFSPCPGCILHIRELNDIVSVASTMFYLSKNPHAYNQSIRWKFEGPSDSFKALLDMAAVHSSCRLCIHLATIIREKEEKALSSPKRPCKCTRGEETVYHVYARERGRFEMESIFLRSSNLTIEALETAILSKFKSIRHKPIWKLERPESIRGGDELKIYRIYPVGMTQRQALYTFRFKTEAEFKSHVEENPCAKFEVIFV
ncbi:putative fucosyltransferase-like protein [Impatiens glandulifera]|uniref:putative fucosyltransferase-like protein n=1 Tax=Impatiens glandulifera TaxID=253017 RepID=UPI001FB10407|nr:putative fucosyltransferase-like protein [Impatiens glandulifera]